jgi:hypothetical protein
MLSFSLHLLIEITEFAQGKVDPHEAGKQGGSTTGTGGNTSGSAGTTSGDSDGGNYKPTEHGGLKEDGTPDGRVKQ